MSPVNPQSLRVGIVGGTHIPGNVRTFLSNIRGLLADHPTRFECDLIVRRRAGETIEGFTTIDPGITETDRAMGTVSTLTRAITEYASSAPVDVLFQVTKFPAHGFATTVAGWRTNTPTVVRLAGDNFREYHLSNGIGDQLRTLGLNNLLGQIPVRFAETIIVLGPHGRDEILKRNPSATVREIPQPIDRDVFHPVSNGCVANRREELGICDNERVLLSVGRLSRRKGMEGVIATARVFAERDLDVRWLVLGDGPLREQLAETPGVEVVGPVPHENTPKYYHAADLLVHPSLIEGLPNVLLEAAACGLPSVARDVGDASLVASATYDAVSDLPALVSKNHEPVHLGDQFSPEKLCNAYADALIRTVHGV